MIASSLVAPQVEVMTKVSGNFVHTQLVARGDAKDVRTLVARYVDGAHFQLSKAMPVPADLDFELNNLVKTGYDALYGDWQSVARQWMLKEYADNLNLPFPLESREDVTTAKPR